jgi:hypothetical protein
MRGCERDTASGLTRSIGGGEQHTKPGGVHEVEPIEIEHKRPARRRRVSHPLGKLRGGSQIKRAADREDQRPAGFSALADVYTGCKSFHAGSKRLRAQELAGELFLARGGIVRGQYEHTIRPCGSRCAPLRPTSQS